MLILTFLQHIHAFPHGGSSIASRIRGGVFTTSLTSKTAAKAGDSAQPSGTQRIYDAHLDGTWDTCPAPRAA